jgi:peroxidase
VPLGRRDSLTASLEESNSDLPAPFLDLDGLIAAFQKKNFSTEEMVTLSGNSMINSLNLLHQITFQSLYIVYYM